MLGKRRDDNQTSVEIFLAFLLVKQCLNVWEREQVSTQSRAPLKDKCGAYFVALVAAHHHQGRP